MSDVIPVAFSARWSMPILIIQADRIERITGPADAIRHMRTYLSNKTDPLYRRAFNVCLAGLRREAELDTARSFFLAAYQDHLRMSLQAL
jgi:hypothetical protein